MRSTATHVPIESVIFGISVPVTIIIVFVIVTIVIMGSTSAAMSHSSA